MNVLEKKLCKKKSLSEIKFSKQLKITFSSDSSDFITITVSKSSKFYTKIKFVTFLRFVFGLF